MRLPVRFRHALFESRFAAWITSCFVRALMATMRYRVRGWDSTLALARERGVVMVLWHDSLMLPLGHSMSPGTTALVSPDRDGEFLTRVLAHVGVKAARGSTNRSGARALRESLQATQQQGVRLVITPDGPRGPRRELRDGALWVAAQARLPLVAFAAVPKRAWHARSWDRFRVPLPFTRIAVCFSEPMLLDEDWDQNADSARARVTAALAAVDAEARQLLQGTHA